MESDEELMAWLRKVARPFLRYGGLELDELVNAGWVAWSEAQATYDPSRGSLRQYAHKSVRGAMVALLSRHQPAPAQRAERFGRAQDVALDEDGSFEDVLESADLLATAGWANAGAQRTPVGELILGESRRQVAAALETLPPRYARAFELLHAEDQCERWSMEDFARALGYADAGSVRRVHRKVLRALRAALHELRTAERHWALARPLG
ncbi:MAG: sigma-70 family RNA polymerase sigma factor [Sandaracinaceae bacterium]|nr:sigma-70 family RNA polymerase sigma factor [Sandaracinaceae bacterium]